MWSRRRSKCWRMKALLELGVVRLLRRSAASRNGAVRRLLRGLQDVQLSVGWLCDIRAAVSVSLVMTVVGMNSRRSRCRKGKERKEVVEARRSKNKNKS